MEELNKHGAVKDATVKALTPVAKLLGHTLACSVGFVGLALLSLVPVLTVKALVMMGLEGLAEHLHSLETFIFTVDIVLFGVVFLAGVAEFALEVFGDAKRNIAAQAAQLEEERES